MLINFSVFLFYHYLCIFRTSAKSDNSLKLPLFIMKKIIKNSTQIVVSAIMMAFSFSAASRMGILEAVSYISLARVSLSLMNACLRISLSLFLIPFFPNWSAV